MDSRGFVSMLGCHRVGGLCRLASRRSTRKEGVLKRLKRKSLDRSVDPVYGSLFKFALNRVAFAGEDDFSSS